MDGQGDSYVLIDCNIRAFRVYIPGYGTLPNVISSYKSIPNDQTSDLILNFLSNAASGAVHLIGNFVSVIKKTANINKDLFFVKAMNKTNYEYLRAVVHSCY